MGALIMCVCVTFSPVNMSNQLICESGSGCIVSDFELLLLNEGQILPDPVLRVSVPTMSVNECVYMLKLSSNCYKCAS